MTRIRFLVIACLLAAGCGADRGSEAAGTSSTSTSSTTTTVAPTTTEEPTTTKAKVDEAAREGCKILIRDNGDPYQAVNFFALSTDNQIEAIANRFIDATGNDDDRTAFAVLAELFAACADRGFKVK